MKIDSILAQQESEMANAETIKALILERLQKEKAISKKVYDDYMRNWQIIMIKYSWYKRFFKSLTSDQQKEGNNYYYKFVRLLDDGQIL